MATISYPNHDSNWVESAVVTFVNNDSMPSDGFITNVQVYAGSSDTGSVSSRGVVYVGTTRQFLGASVNLSGSSTYNFGSINQSCGVRATAGQTIRWGLGMGTPTGAGFPAVHVDSVSGHAINLNEDSNAPSTWSGTQTVSSSAIRGTLTYIANSAPFACVISAPTAGQVIAGTTLTVAATLPHPSAEEAAGEYSTSYRIVIKNSGGSEVLNQLFNTTSTEQANGSFSRSVDVSSLGPGSYTVTCQHTDSFGLTSAFPSGRAFSIAQPAPPPTPLAPSGKINVISGYNYSSQYNNPAGLSATHATYNIYNGLGESSLRHQTTFALGTHAPGATLNTPEWHTDLLWGSTYGWKVSYTDTAGVMSEWSPLTNFNTNSVPNAPTGLVPSQGTTYTSLSFYANISDPDNDTMSGGEIEIRRVSDSVVVHTGSMTVDNATKTMQQTIGSGILVAGTAYEWRCRVGDQNSALQGKGAWSAWTGFTFATGANVTRLAPDNRINLIENPRAESVGFYGGTYWTELNRIEDTDFIEAVPNIDAPSGGGYVWRGHASATRGYGVGNYMVGPKHTIDATKPYLLSAEFRKIAGTNPFTHLGLRCYSAADADLGLIFPSNGFGGGLQNADPSTKWTRYGGVVGISGILSWPANTAKVRVEIILSNTADSVVEMDCVQLERLPVMTSTEWASMKVWYGYADGATVVDADRSTNTWLGEPYLSGSSVAPLLSFTTPAFLIDYVYGIAKQDDRVKVEQWRAGTWVQVYDTGYVAGTRELIPLANGSLPDDIRARVTIYARDTTNVEVILAPFEVDVAYTGPAELEITSVTENPERASISLTHETSALGLEFNGLQIARSEDGVNFEIVAQIKSASSSEYEYHAPRSGVEYTFRVRQIQRITGTSYDIYGRWSSAVGEVYYYPNFFIKDINDPDNLLGFRVLVDDHQPYLYGANEDRHELGGDEYPTFFTGTPRSKTTEVTMYLGEGHNLEGTVEERWEKVIQFEQDRPTIVFLDSFHDEKVIAQIYGEATLDEGIYGGKRRATFALEEVDYQEDVTDTGSIF